MPPPPTPAVRNQFTAPVGGGHSHIHPDNGPTGWANGGFGSTRSPVTACRRRVVLLVLQFPPFARGNHGPACHQRRITGPHPAANAGNNASGHSPRARPRPVACPPNRGFGSIRSSVTACRRRVVLLVLQFPPASHVEVTETRHNLTIQPTPRAAGAGTPHSCARTSSHRTRTPQRSNTIRRFKQQRTDSYRTRIHS